MSQDRRYKNQTAVSAAFNSLDPNNADVQTILDAFRPLTNEQAAAGLNFLTGEVFGSTNFATNTSALFIANSLTSGLNGFSAADSEETQTTSAAIGALALAPNMMPKVGAGKRPGIFYNTGHGHLGWTLGAATAEIAAEIVLTHARSNR